MSSDFSKRPINSKRYWYGLERWINPMGLGCWQIAGTHTSNGKPNGWGIVNEPNAIRLIHTALDNGITLFDTAYGYGNGRSEELLGKALSSFKNDAVICTKIPLSDNEFAHLRLSDAFYSKVMDSLKRLKRDRIDILLIHSPPDNIEWGRFNSDMLTQLQADGKIGTYGVSSRSYRGFENVVDAGFGTCVEWVFNLFERRPLDVFQKLKAREMNFIARSPLSRGLLSAKYLHEEFIFGKDDFRSTIPREWVVWVLQSIEALNLSTYEQTNLSKLALQYCLRYEEISAIIPGTNSINHLMDYLTIAHEKYLSDDLPSRLFSTSESCFPKWK